MQVQSRETDTLIDVQVDEEIHAHIRDQLSRQLRPAVLLTVGDGGSPSA
ncbi:hypothetical protein [Actinoplanes sp. NPDC049316]